MKNLPSHNVGELSCEFWKFICQLFYYTHMCVSFIIVQLCSMLYKIWQLSTYILTILVDVIGFIKMIWNQTDFEIIIIYNYNSLFVLMHGVTVYYTDNGCTSVHVDGTRNNKVHRGHSIVEQCDISAAFRCRGRRCLPSWPRAHGSIVATTLYL